ncbi:MAG: UDP-N-acetylgalactosamine-undecaprenyl-phosphate N-acetylgalactosaminephosphotransferase [Candidatus Anoxychlamydiales bacterium]|nr:UDP-N-acetylgalactosamine-undecaprenyl-phosphate N-acetylgalactosaminephosphotransferase [Candidatus Anoxychlamydiales bacterium]
MLNFNKRNYRYPIKHKPIKRIFDIFFCIFIVVLLLPLYLIISLIILFSTKGPIFYISKRLGRGGVIINCIKFRTMHTNADQKLKDLLNKNIALKKEWRKFQKLKKDPRITKIGQFLRKTSLDELPQFFNVLKGDLSIVGPRPFVLMGPVNEFDKEIKIYLKDKTKKILSIRPGITGLWQVSGRSEITIEERLKIEENYIDTQSFFKDLYLILKTIKIIFFPKGAF